MLEQQFQDEMKMFFLMSQVLTKTCVNSRFLSSLFSKTSIKNTPKWSSSHGSPIWTPRPGKCITRLQLHDGVLRGANPQGKRSCNANPRGIFGDEIRRDIRFETCYYSLKQLVE